jgi:hypothetical protein
MTTESEMQSAVRRVVDEVTGADGRLRVTHTVATRGWGDILYVDVYARSPYETWDEEFDHALRTMVADVTRAPRSRVTIRWRISS